MPGPYVNIAAFCERAIAEADGVLTLVRVIDVYNVTAASSGLPVLLPPPDVRVPIETTLAISIKPGDAAVGDHTVRIELVSPGGETNTVSNETMQFASPTVGQNIVTQMRLALRPGLHWADLYVDDRLLTRTPLQINLA